MHTPCLEIPMYPTCTFKHFKKQGGRVEPNECREPFPMLMLFSYLDYLATNFIY